MAKTLLLVGVCLLVAGCCTPLRRVRVFPPCGDGAPVKVLVDPACAPDGVCGYSCLPNRWEKRGV